MILKQYVFFDKMSGEYSQPRSFVNDGVAIRDFVRMMGEPQNAHLKDDISLYFVGDFDTETGELSGIPSKPCFVQDMRGFMDNATVSVKNTGSEVKNE